MNLNSKTKVNALYTVVLAFIFLAASNTANAQSFRPFKYMGFEGTFGARSFKLESSIAQLDRLPVVVRGGSLGVTIGNDILRTKIRGGAYYSASSVPRTVDFFEYEALFNFYPLEFFRRNENLIDIYLVGGIGMDNTKFYGYYLSPVDKKINYSAYEEPYLGKLTQMHLSGGLGLECQLLFNSDFVHLFAEARLGTTLYSAADKQPFEDTSTSRLSSVTVGVSFGLYR